MDYQLVLQFSISEATDFDQLIDLETQLMVALAGKHIVDGHDFGSGEMNIFIHTDDPGDAFDRSKPLIPVSLEPTLKVAYRSLSSDEYTWVYPANSDTAFKIA